MFSPLNNATYRRLFSAQVAALLGTGLATVALGLLAHRLGGASAGEILGIAFAIKMIAYVAVAPFASALAANLPRKTLLIGLDLIRAGVAAMLPFVAEAWQVYALMTVLYVASAAFTPAFQAMIPDILTDEREYTKALSLSRLASDLESVASPVIAAVLLAFVAYNDLFAGTAIGFFLSALLVLSAALRTPRVAQQKTFAQRLTVGFRLFALTPRLRGLVAISLATAAGGAMVFINTVVIVQTQLSLSEQHTAWALAVFGLGSMSAAMLVPRLLEDMPDRIVMIVGGVLMTVGLVAGAFHHNGGYYELLLMWFDIGIGYSLTLTPASRALRRSASAEDRPGLFAAYFALSHACWLIAYPVAGLVSSTWGTNTAFLVLGILSAIGALATWLLWPSHDPESLPHRHEDLPADHPHLAEHGLKHEHAVVIDTWHPKWPSN
jgi:MFS family permease